MYKYEIIIRQDKVKTNDFEQVIEILKWLLDKNCEITFRSVKDNINLTIEDELDIVMLKDNIESS